MKYTDKFDISYPEPTNTIPKPAIADNDYSAPHNAQVAIITVNLTTSNISAGTESIRDCIKSSKFLSGYMVNEGVRYDRGIVSGSSNRSRFELVVIIDRETSTDQWQVDKDVRNAIAPDRRRFIGLITIETNPNNWDRAFRSSERTARNTMNALSEKYAYQIHQCTEAGHWCLCEATGNLRPNTASSWNGERTFVAGRLLDPAVDDTDPAVYLNNDTTTDEDTLTRVIRSAYGMKPEVK